MLKINDCLQQLQNYTGNFVLTISGEITICNKDNTQLLLLTDEEKAAFSKYTVMLQEKFPYLLVEQRENLVELNLKFFAYEKFIADGQFLEAVRSCLAEIVTLINEGARLHARVSASGSMQSSNEQQNFLFLSKASMVEYKITGKSSLNGISAVTAHKIRVYGFAVLLAVLIISALYTLCVHIPDHDPNKLLVNIFDI